jgi:ABC-type Fe3+ transport system permease subunit
VAFPVCSIVLQAYTLRRLSPTYSVFENSLPRSAGDSLMNTFEYSIRFAVLTSVVMALVVRWSVKITACRLLPR